MTSYLIEQLSSGPVVRSMSTCGHVSAFQVDDVHRVVTMVHRRDAGRHRDRRREERHSQVCCDTGFAVRVAASMCPWWPGREDGVAVDDALRREPSTLSLVVTEHPPPSDGLTACTIRKYIEREDGEGRDHSQKCDSKTSRSKDAGVVQG